MWQLEAIHNTASKFAILHNGKKNSPQMVRLTITVLLPVRKAFHQDVVQRPSAPSGCWQSHARPGRIGRVYGAPRQTPVLAVFLCAAATRRASRVVVALQSRCVCVCVARSRFCVLFSRGVVSRFLVATMPLLLCSS